VVDGLDLDLDLDRAREIRKEESVSIRQVLPVLLLCTIAGSAASVKTSPGLLLSKQPEQSCYDTEQEKLLNTRKAENRRSQTNKSNT
jgi:hypothetical protein